MDNPFSLSASEKNVLLEAKKSAEYYDSFERLDYEAHQIVNMLHKSKFTVVFTG